MTDDQSNLVDGIGFTDDSTMMLQVYHIMVAETLRLKTPKRCVADHRLPIA